MTSATTGSGVRFGRESMAQRAGRRHRAPRLHRRLFRRTADNRPAFARSSGRCCSPPIATWDLDRAANDSEDRRRSGTSWSRAGRHRPAPQRHRGKATGAVSCLAARRAAASGRFSARPRQHRAAVRTATRCFFDLLTEAAGRAASPDEHYRYLFALTSFRIRRFWGARSSTRCRRICGARTPRCISAPSSA
mgnify:CR=1 FL=1